MKQISCQGLVILSFLFLFGDIFGRASLELPVQTWVEQQAQILVKQTAHTPPEQREALINHVFLTHHITSDSTTLPSDWARVTGDGARVDPWDLTERIYLLGQKIKWPVFVSENDQGPLLLVGEGPQRVGCLIPLGKQGYLSAEKLPPALSEIQWQQTLQTRRALLESSVGHNQTLMSLEINDPVTPTLAWGLCVQDKKSIDLGQMVNWALRWPHYLPLVRSALKEARRHQNSQKFDVLWQNLVSPDDPLILLEGALWMYQQGDQGAAVSRLKKLLKQDPYHIQALILLEAWS